MSMIPKCVVCDRPVASVYAPDSLCERCKVPCQTCGKNVAYCAHPLAATETILELEAEDLGGGLMRVAA